MNYAELKGIIYIVQAAFGVLLLGLSWFAHQSDEPSWQIAALVLLGGAFLLILFSSVTVIIRDDPDVWR